MWTLSLKRTKLCSEGKFKDFKLNQIDVRQRLFFCWKVLILIRREMPNIFPPLDSSASFSPFSLPKRTFDVCNQEKWLSASSLRLMKGQRTPWEWISAVFLFWVLIVCLFLVKMNILDFYSLLSNSTNVLLSSWTSVCEIEIHLSKHLIRSYKRQWKVRQRNDTHDLIVLANYVTVRILTLPA